MTKRVKKGTWAQRVAEWRASGLTSVKFCEGRDFTPGGLRHAAYRLEQTRSMKCDPPRIQMARVLRAPERMAGTAAVAAPACVAVAVQMEPRIVVELGGARVTIQPGVDRATLATVLEVLAGAAR